MDTLNQLALEIGNVLKNKQQTLALAESCTGGMLSELITRVPGSSQWFDCAFVTYSNQSKINMLGVSNRTLNKFGAVSEETAKEMVLGVFLNSQATVAGSITGIAGPDGGSTQKPVGTVSFSWQIKSGKLHTNTQQFYGGRDDVRQQSCRYLLQVLLATLKAE
jgi:nicotinamide-nucleotide amidase